jgi:hypothetical protein
MNILKTAFFAVLRPKDFFKTFKDIPLNFTLRYMFTLALIGPILSFYSMFVIENIPLWRTVLYGITTYFLDILCTYIFAFILYKLEKRERFDLYLKLAVFSSTAIWLSDIVDIHQMLRPLSTVGLLYSLYLLYVAFSYMRISAKRIFVYIFIFIILYVLNALIAEAIVQNPIVARLMS